MQAKRINVRLVEHPIARAHVRSGAKQTGPHFFATGFAPNSQTCIHYLFLYGPPQTLRFLHTTYMMIEYMGLKILT